mmetsp:Transcript_12430/g.30386  ORF Transcript_12430/g.30386 Transcript_12430/m.30386 type:complete len:648 (-) Transcript_12430:114-2057(-)
MPLSVSGGIAASLVVASVICGKNDFVMGATSAVVSAYATPPAYYPPSVRLYRGHSGGSRRSGGVSMAAVSSPSSSPHSDHHDGPYVRIQKRGRHYDVQTAVTTFRRRRRRNTIAEEGGGAGSTENDCDLTVDLHAQIHFGDASYFEYFNDDTEFGGRYDAVLYELIVPDEFLAPIIHDDATRTNNNSNDNDDLPLKRLIPADHTSKNPVAPTRSDRNTASQYGLTCQVDAVRYCGEKWIHADLTREEFLDRIEEGKRNEAGHNGRKKRDATAEERPLWALASTAATYPGADLVSSLLRPLSPDNRSGALSRRLFTHLFLPGDAASGWIRAALWMGVPSPELSVMLVDWSSLSHVGGRRRRRSSRGSGGGGGGSDGEDDSGIAPISPIAAPVLLSLLTGNWGTARRLVFGQVLVGGTQSSSSERGDSSRGNVLIDGRNERAMDVLREVCRMESSGPDDEGWHNDDGKAGGGGRRGGRREKSIALLYGAAHCRDLQRRLAGEGGMTPVRTEWRTAFRATAPRWGDYFANGDDNSQRRMSDAALVTSPSSSAGGKIVEGNKTMMSASALESAAVGLVVLPLYLLIGGLDWVSALGDIGVALDRGTYLDGIAGAMFYLVRHAALYVAMSKFVVDWGGSGGAFGEEEDYDDA